MPTHEGTDGFDIILGPKTDRQVLGQSVASCLSTKGFCVLKAFQEGDEFAASFSSLKDMESKNLFSRLPKELEKNLLGKGGRAKSMWLDPSDYTSAFDASLWAIDGNMTNIADDLVPFAADALGYEFGERATAMVCLSMSDQEEDQYEYPPIDSRRAFECYNTLMRGKVRMVHFLGPDAGEVTLQSADKEYAISASVNSILLVREDTFEYAYEEPAEGESAWMQCFILEPVPEWEVEDFEEEGLVQIFGKEVNGPPPPTQDLVSVSAAHLQTAANMVSKPKEWAAYLSGVDGQVEMPLIRFDMAPYYDPDPEGGVPGKSFVKHFSYQEGAELFDNKAFDISNAEASALDPMYRQVIEISMFLLDAKGITKKYCNGHPTHASVSVGCDKNEWLQMPYVPSSVATNNQLAIAANRINYIFNLKGGSFVADTACSSSLIGAHLGKVNLLEQRWDPLAYHLAFGCGLTLQPFSFIGGTASHTLSNLGRCLTFNASANGYNRGDGTSGIFMEFGDKEDKLVFFRGSQIGNDGRSASMAAPNGPAQEKCIWGAVREARMTPPESTVWECHGTGTALGDPIEVGAVRKVQIKEKRIEPLQIQTSKSNLGHLEGAAAMLAMVKCVVMVTKCRCPPTIHFRTLNPHLDHAQFEAVYTSEATAYKYSRGHCQVSSFGIGGTNGHAIFWGEDAKLKDVKVDYKEMLLKKLSTHQPSVGMDDPDPKNWTLVGPGVKINPKEKYKVSIRKDPVTGETPLQWLKIEDEGSKQSGFFSISSNCNSWSPQKLSEGAMPGLYYLIETVPEEGELQFRFMVEDDKNRQFGPLHNSEKRSAKIQVERAACQTYWSIIDAPGVIYRIELMVSAKGTKAVNWSSTDVADTRFFMHNPPEEETDGAE